jgi:uncharacterized membrane protein
VGVLVGGELGAAVADGGAEVGLLTGADDGGCGGVVWSLLVGGVIGAVIGTVVGAEVSRVKGDVADVVTNGLEYAVTCDVEADALGAAALVPGAPGLADVVGAHAPGTRGAIR